MRRFLAALLGAGLALSTAYAEAPTVKRNHGLSLFGDVALPADFAHQPGVNPDAPKGGQLRLAAIGSFDSLNPFILKGEPATGLGLTYDTLMADAANEPASEYGLIAEWVEVPEDFSFVTFRLREAARFHDGHPIRAEDVVFSFETLRDKGRPFYRFYYANVAKVEALDELTVKFTFDKAGNRELPQIMGQLMVLPKHYWADKDFAATTLDPPLGSGAYKIEKADAGRSVTYSRVKDHWAANLPINKGRWNFDTISYEFYRDDTVALEAFKAGEFDVRAENTAKNWATAYDFPALKQGKVKKEVLHQERAQAMQAFIFNTRRAKFSDPRVRRAFALAFDFEWMNKTLFYGQYTRTHSYFDGSELAAKGLPSEAERALLKPFRDQLPPELFTTPYSLPVTDGSGQNRTELREAGKLLKAAGWEVLNGTLTHTKTGEKMEVEFLLVSPAFERIVAHYKQSLERLGIKASLRVIDPAQYQNRVDGFEFDIISGGWAQSLSPGNEQRDFWGSQAAARSGSRNYAGINNPVIDAFINKIIFAESRADLVAATRALDRVLLWGHYVVPQWHIKGSRMAWWDKFERPETPPRYQTGFPDTWWAKATSGSTNP
ncbi:MAG: extracellular solute-binding protein [Alphaproteobacteria bacterium]